MSFRFLASSILTRNVRPCSSRNAFSISKFYFSTGNGVIEDVRGIMRKVPQPVVVVTTSKPDDPNYRRGITVASFTSVCLNPEPLVSFCVRIPSRASELLHSSGSMVLNMLSHEQVQQSVAFSSPSADQFKDIPFFDDPQTGLPVLMGTVGAMHCEAFKVIQLGDHELWITKVLKVEEGVGGIHGIREESHPLLYYDRCYRSVGDQVFMKAVEDDNEGTIKWMHRAHLRMAWNYIRELGPDAAEPVIKQTIRKHFKKNPTKSKDYHETITSFYIALVSAAVRSYKGGEYESDFFALVEKFPELLDPKTIETYYSPDKLYTDEARQKFIHPDLKPLPNRL